MEVMQKNRKNAAFTLIELLVVVSIIALLVSILMPALGRARDQAKRVRCAANLHQIGVGLHTYAASYEGTLPPTYWQTYCEQPGATHTMDEVPTPTTTYYAYGCNVNPPYDILSGPFNLAYMYTAKIIDQPEVFYCDGLKNDQSTNEWKFCYENFHQVGYPWPTPAGDGKGTVRVSYCYWPQSGKKRYVPKNGGFPAGQTYPAPTLKTSSLTADYSTCTDLIYSYHALPHDMRGEPTGLNALFGDMHVSFSQNEDAFDEYLWPKDTELVDPRNPGDNPLKWITIVSLLRP